MILRRCIACGCESPRCVEGWSDDGRFGWLCLYHRHVHQCRFGKLFPASKEPEATHDYHECECGAVREDEGEWHFPVSLADRTRGMSQGNRKGPSLESQAEVRDALSWYAPKREKPQ